MVNIHKRLLFAALALGLSAGMAWAQAPNAPGPDEPRPGTRADRQEDQQELQQLQQQTQLDRQRLQADIQQFGPKSPQARADRRQLRHDRQRLRQLRRDRPAARPPNCPASWRTARAGPLNLETRRRLSPIPLRVSSQRVSGRSPETWGDTNKKHSSATESRLTG